MSWEEIEAKFCPEPNTGCWLWLGYREKFKAHVRACYHKRKAKAG